MSSKHWVIEFRNEWKQLFGEWNWYSFTLIHIYFEKSYHGYEFWFTLLGLGFYLRYNTDKSLEQFDEWGRDAQDAAEAKPLDEWIRELKEDVWEIPKKPINRVEVIDDTGRAYVNQGVKDAMVDYQDDGRTLKVFINDNHD